MERTTRDLRLSGDGLTTGRNLASNELDAVLARWGMEALPAICAKVCATTGGEAILRPLTGDNYVLVPIWARHHWVAGLWDGPRKILWTADSAPSDAVRADINALRDVMGAKMGIKVRIVPLPCYHQPPLSFECGLHLLRNSCLMWDRRLLGQQEWPARGSAYLKLEHLADYFSRGSPREMLIRTGEVSGGIAPKSYADVGDKNGMDAFIACALLVKEFLQQGQHANTGLAGTIMELEFTNSGLYSCATALIRRLELGKPTRNGSYNLPVPEEILRLICGKLAFMPSEGVEPAVSYGDATLWLIAAPAVGDVRVAAHIKKLPSKRRQGLAFRCRPGGDKGAQGAAVTVPAIESSSPEESEDDEEITPLAPTLRVAGTPDGDDDDDEALLFPDTPLDEGAAVEVIPLVWDELHGEDAEMREEDVVADDDSDRARPVGELFLWAEPMTLEGIRESATIQELALGWGKPAHVHQVAWKAVSGATRKSHQRLLHLLKDLLARNPTWPLEGAALELIRSLAETRKWAWTTTEKTMGSLAGALRDLPLYAAVSSGLTLMGATWRAMQRRVSHMAKQESVKPVNGLPVSVYRRLVSLQGCAPQASLLLSLTWALAGRTGDVLQLQKEDFDLGAAAGDAVVRMDVEFRRGKGAFYRRPYIVPAMFTAREANKLRGWLANLRPTQRLFRDPTRTRRQMLALLRSAGKYDTRSIRRGAAQELARVGTPLQTIMMFTGHTQVSTLLSYLDNGRKTGPENEEARRAARRLVGGGPQRQGLLAREEDGYPGDKGRRRPQDPAEFLGAKATSNEDLGIQDDMPVGDPRWPIHAKHVSMCDIGAVRLLEMSVECKSFLESVIPWTWDADKYAKACPRTVLRKAKLSKENVARLVEVGKMEPVTKEMALEHPTRGTANVFLVADGHKERWRPICEPLTNRDLGKETLQRLRYPSRLNRRQLAAGCDLLVFDFDFAAFYDAIGLSKAVRAFMRVGAPGPDGKTGLYQFKVIPMGLRQAVEVAQGITWALVDFPKHASTKIVTNIDNVRIICDPAYAKEGLGAVRTFLRRVKTANLTLNDVDVGRWLADTDAELTSRGEKNVDFLGERFCFEGKTTVANTQRCVAKLEKALVVHRSQLLTRRHFAGLIGLMVYMSHTVDVRLSSPKWYTVLRAYRAICAEAGTGWDVLIKVEDSVWAAMQGIADILLENIAVEVRPRIPGGSEPTHAIITDACLTGWGAVYINISEGTIMTMRMKWAVPIKDSAAAEPKAMHMAVLRFLPAVFNGRCLLVSDHSPIGWTEYNEKGNRGFAKSYELNKLHEALRRLGPEHFECHFIAGDENEWADFLSREQADMRRGETTKEISTDRDRIPWAAFKRLREEDTPRTFMV